LSIPYGFANYAYGLTAIRFWPHLLATVIAIIPGNLLRLDWATAQAGLRFCLAAPGKASLDLPFWRLDYAHWLRQWLHYEGGACRRDGRQAGAKPFHELATALEGLYVPLRRRFSCWIPGPFHSMIRSVSHSLSFHRRHSPLTQETAQVPAPATRQSPPSPRFRAGGSVPSEPADSARDGADSGRDVEDLTLAPGFKIELVASEPMISAPVAMQFDPDGRLWVVEMNGSSTPRQGREESNGRWSCGCETTGGWTEHDVSRQLGCRARAIMLRGRRARRRPAGIYWCRIQTGFEGR
jgi:hypothetical protein